MSAEPYLATYLHNKGGRLGLPIGGSFELTARCNFNCPMCYVHEQEPVGELTADRWIDLARQAKEAGLVFALLTGGEPFARKDFFEIYSAMKAMGIMVSINSNGSMLSGQILEQLKENPPYRVNISLYGGCAETYRKMCGRDAFEQVLENIRAVKNAGIDVRLNVSITPYNKEDIRKIYEISQELGVHVKGTSYMYPPIRATGDLRHRLSAEEAAEAAVLWDQLRLTPEQFSRMAERMRQRECAVDLDDEGVGCRAGSSSFWLAWDGRMLPCGMMPGPEAYPLEVGFDNAWQQIRRATREIRMPHECTVCRNREFCHVCAAVTVTETGRFDAVPEYVCRMTQGIIERSTEWK